MYNGINIYQIPHYIKLNVKTFIEKVIECHIATWMKISYPTPNHSMPLPPQPKWIKKLNAATSDTNKKVQAPLAKRMQLPYHSGIGKLIWAMTTCLPDLAYTSIKLLQSNTCPE